MYKVCWYLSGLITPHLCGIIGLVRLRDNLLAQLQELNRSKSRGKADENIISEITRLESAITVTKDDLVRAPTLCVAPFLDR